MKEYWLSTDLAFCSFNTVRLTMDSLEKYKSAHQDQRYCLFPCQNYITHNAALPTSLDIEGSSVRSGLSHFFCSYKTCEQTVVCQICALYPLIYSTIFFLVGLLEFSVGACQSIHSQAQEVRLRCLVSTWRWVMGQYVSTGCHNVVRVSGRGWRPRGECSPCCISCTYV